MDHPRTATRAAKHDDRRTNLKRIPARESLQYSARFSRARLDALRHKGDPLADAVATELHANHGGLTNVRDLLSTVRANAVPAGAPSCERCPLRRFLDASAEVPSWADPDVIARGQRVHAVYYPMIGLSLFSGSLVGGAQFSNAAIVTALAGNINNEPARRVSETGLLLASIALPGSLLQSGSAAHDSLTRVRLLHAALRHWLPRSGRLDAHKALAPDRVYHDGEIPLNQQDLAITLGIFCYLNLRSLRRMGVVLRSSDIKAYVAMWRYAGHVLGIDHDILPETLEIQEDFMLASMLHQGAPEAISETNTREFISAFARRFATALRVVPADTMQVFFEQVTRHLNGMEYTTGMQLDDLGAGHWSIVLTRFLGWTVGTLAVRYTFGLGESAMFNLNTWGIRRQLKARGVPIGHAAGSGGVAPRQQSHL